MTIVLMIISFAIGWFVNWWKEFDAVWYGGYNCADESNKLDYKAGKEAGYREGYRNCEEEIKNEWYDKGFVEGFKKGCTHKEQEFQQKTKECLYEIININFKCAGEECEYGQGNKCCKECDEQTTCEGVCENVYSDCDDLIREEVDE